MEVGLSDPRSSKEHLLPTVYSPLSLCVCICFYLCRSVCVLSSSLHQVAAADHPESGRHESEAEQRHPLTSNGVRSSSQYKTYLVLLISKCVL